MKHLNYKYKGFATVSILYLVFLAFFVATFMLYYTNKLFDRQMKYNFYLDYKTVALQSDIYVNEWFKDRWTYPSYWWSPWSFKKIPWRKLKDNYTNSIYVPPHPTTELFKDSMLYFWGDTPRNRTPVLEIPNYVLSKIRRCNSDFKIEAYLIDSYYSDLLPHKFRLSGINFVRKSIFAVSNISALEAKCEYYGMRTYYRVIIVSRKDKPNIKYIYVTSVMMRRSLGNFVDFYNNGIYEKMLC